LDSICVSSPLSSLLSPVSSLLSPLASLLSSRLSPLSSLLLLVYLAIVAPKCAEFVESYLEFLVYLGNILPSDQNKKASVI
jgi:hypothetical protein